MKKSPIPKPPGAVGLAYEDRHRSVPTVSCKGTGLVADRIRQIATRHGIPIIEDPRLVDALIEIEEDAEIPREVFEAVAGVIAALAAKHRDFDGMGRGGAPTEHYGNPTNMLDVD